MNSRVTISIDRGIADIRLARPEKLNALDAAMFDALLDVGETVANDPSVRVVVLSGQGRGFCAGLDASALGAMAGPVPADNEPALERTAKDRFVQAASDLTARLDGRIANLFQQVAHQWSELAVPVLAACHGPVLGGGLQIALGADIRFTTPDAKWSVLEIRWGLLPDMTGIQQLVRLVGLDLAKELSFTGRMISGQQAGELGIATHVTDHPYDDAMSLAEELCTKNPQAIRGMKALCNAAGMRPLAESLLAESQLMASLIGSANQIEATTAYLQGRAPSFIDE